MSKGSKRRPAAVDRESYNERWERTFGSAKTHAPKPELGARGESDAFYIAGPDPLFHKDPEEMRAAIRRVFGRCGVEVVINNSIPPGRHKTTITKKVER